MAATPAMITQLQMLLTPTTTNLKTTPTTTHPPTPISVDARAIIYSDDFGVITRDRVETKAQKLSRQFMKRARIALYGPGV